MASGEVTFPKLATGAMSPQTSPAPRTQSSIPLNETLTEFHCFPRLPLELRRKIWNAYLDQQPGRIIELGWDTTNFGDEHDGYKVTNLSSRTPLVLRDLICREARDEALRKYQPWCFDNRPEGHTPPSRITYFDPSIDTIYFGRYTCVGTMCCFLDNLVRTEKQLPRVAIFCWNDKRKNHSICSYSYVAGEATGDPHPSFIDATASYDELLLWVGLNFLHGMQVDKLPNLSNGWPNLEEIILCVSVFQHADESTTFRPATHFGKFFEKRFLLFFQSIQNFQSGKSQLVKWAPDKQPKVHFASLSKRAEPGKVFDLLSMLPSGVWDKKRYVNDITSLSNPHCQVRLAAIVGQSYHFEFYGTEEGVFAAKKACLTTKGSIEESFSGDTWRQKTEDQWKEWNFQFGKSFLY